MTPEKMKDLLFKVDNNAVSAYFADLLTDYEISTYDMFEDLVNAYYTGDDSFRAGIDTALRIITWKNLGEIATVIEKRFQLKEE